MTQYDQEFEEWFLSATTRADATLKEKLHQAWQAAKAPPQPEVKPLELEGGGFYVNLAAKVQEFLPGCDELKNAGKQRKTRELAEAAAEKMRKRDRLHAFVTEHCGYEYEWSDTKYNHFIAFSHRSNTYIVNSNDIHESLGVVYMPRETAEYLCAALNNGRLVL